MKQKAIQGVKLRDEREIHRKKQLICVSNNKLENEMEKFDSQKQINICKTFSTIPNR